MKKPRPPTRRVVAALALLAAHSGSACSGEDDVDPARPACDACEAKEYTCSHGAGKESTTLLLKAQHGWGCEFEEVTPPSKLKLACEPLRVCYGETDTCGAATFNGAQLVWKFPTNEYLCYPE